MVSFDLALKVHYPCCYCHCGSRICGNKQVYVMLNYIDTEFSSIVSVWWLLVWDVDVRNRQLFHFPIPVLQIDTLGITNLVCWCVLSCVLCSVIVVSSLDSGVLCGLFWHRLSTCSGQMLTVWCLKVLNLSAHSSGLCGCSVLVQYSCDSHLLILFGLHRSIALHAGVCMTGMMSDGYMVRTRSFSSLPYTAAMYTVICRVQTISD